MAIGDGLLAFWILGEAGSAIPPPITYVDSTGRGNDLSGNAESQTAPCTPRAIYFHEGTSQKITRANTTDLQRSGTFMFGGWAYLSSQAQAGALIAKEGSSIVTFDYELMWIVPGNILRWRTRQGADAGYDTVDFASSPTVDAWYYVEAYHSSGGTIGVRASPVGGPLASYTVGSADATIHSGTGGFGMGSHPATSGDHANADRMYNWGLWNRILSVAESDYLLGLSTGNCPPTYPFPANPVCVNFQATIAREGCGSDESCNAYGGITNLEICDPIAAGHYCLQANVVDLDGAVPGDNIRIRVRRLWSDPLNTSIDPCSLVKVAIEYDVN